MKRNGFSIVEIIVAAAIVALVVTAAASAWQIYLQITGQTKGIAQAALLVEEGGEAITLLRDEGWTANISPLSVGTTYYLYWNGSAYALSASPVVVGGQFTRTVVLSHVIRDGSFDFTGTSTACDLGAGCDQNTLDAMISVSFASSSQPLAQSEMLIHNVFNN